MRKFESCSLNKCDSFTIIISGKPNSVQHIHQENAANRNIGDVGNGLHLFRVTNNDLGNPESTAYVSPTHTISVHQPQHSNNNNTATIYKVHYCGINTWKHK